MKQKANLGDVFIVPVDPPRFGVGQIAGNWKGELYIVIYDVVCDGGKIDVESVVSEKPLFAALSLDAKIFNGDWQIIGNVTDNLAGILHPTFKVNQEGEVFIESRDRSMTRRASSEKIDTLRFQNGGCADSD